MFRALSMIAAKIKGSAPRANPLLFLVPEVGIEPTLSQGEGDFECKTGYSQKAIGFIYMINFNGLFLVRKVGKDEVIFEKSGNDGHKNRHRTTAILYREPDMETRSRGMELTLVLIGLPQPRHAFCLLPRLDREKGEVPTMHKEGGGLKVIECHLRISS